jgi:hypothetical protein
MRWRDCTAFVCPPVCNFACLWSMVVALSDDLACCVLRTCRFTEPGANSPKRRWIRAVSLLVLMYEGTIQGCFDYDYAPSSEVVGGRRVYMNISQEGRDDLDDLREAECIAGLKLSSNGFYSMYVFGCSLCFRFLVSAHSSALCSHLFFLLPALFSLSSVCVCVCVCVCCVCNLCSLRLAVCHESDDVFSNACAYVCSCTNTCICNGVIHMCMCECMCWCVRCVYV